MFLRQTLRLQGWPGTAASSCLGALAPASSSRLFRANACEAEAVGAFTHHPLPVQGATAVGVHMAHLHTCQQGGVTKLFLQTLASLHFHLSPNKVGKLMPDALAGRSPSYSRQTSLTQHILYSNKVPPRTHSSPELARKFAMRARCQLSADCSSSRGSAPAGSQQGSASLEAPVAQRMPGGHSEWIEFHLGAKDHGKASRLPSFNCSKF